MAYVIYNEELGYELRCPVFDDKKEAEDEAAGKCRRHSVVEIETWESCKPFKKYNRCSKCLRYYLRQHYDKAIQFVKDNKDWTEEEESVALRHINDFRCSLPQASERITFEIGRMMDEYGSENELAPDWWREIGDEDDVFFKLG